MAKPTFTQRLRETVNGVLLCDVQTLALDSIALACGPRSLKIRNQIVFLRYQNFIRNLWTKIPEHLTWSEIGNLLSVGPVLGLRLQSCKSPRQKPSSFLFGKTHLSLHFWGEFGLTWKHVLEIMRYVRSRNISIHTRVEISLIWQ